MANKSDMDEAQAEIASLKVEYQGVCEAMIKLKYLNREATQEVHEVNNRKPNLIVKGIPEKVGAGTNDLVKELFQLIEITLNPVASYRLGPLQPDAPYPRPIRIIMADEIERNKVLEKAVNLKSKSSPNIPGDKVYISKDLTKYQREQAKKLRDKRREMREKFPNWTWTIVGDRLVRRKPVPTTD